MRRYCPRCRRDQDDDALCEKCGGLTLYRPASIVPMLDYSDLHTTAPTDSEGAE